MSWMLETCTPLFTTSILLLSRTDITEAQAWNLLWRDGALERSAQFQPPGSKTYYQSNSPSPRLADHVAGYLARPDVPPGSVGRVRQKFDSTALTRLDLLRAVIQRGGSDLVSHEIAAEPPAGSDRGPRLGGRERALIDRYRATVDEADMRRSRDHDEHLGHILAEPDLVRRVNCARSMSALDDIDILNACIFGHGSVAPPPECADPATAEWLEAAATNVMYYGENHLLGPVISALRPILRMHRDPTDMASRRWWSRRFRAFGEAGTVPHTFALPSEEGDYIIRMLGDNVDRYRSLATRLDGDPDESLRESCLAT